MYRLWQALKRDEKGATAIEYGLILALVVLTMLSALSTLASKTTRMWNGVSNNVTAAG